MFLGKPPGGQLLVLNAHVSRKYVPDARILSVSNEDFQSDQFRARTTYTDRLIFKYVHMKICQLNNNFNRGVTVTKDEITGPWSENSNCWHPPDLIKIIAL